jgi:hypothetical protein
MRQPKTEPARDDKLATEHLIKRSEDTRANIREMARWLILGLGAILTFAVGGSGLAPLGALEWWPRFSLAIFCLLAAAGSCVWPLIQAIDIMTMRTYGVDEVYFSPRFANARAKVEEQLLNGNWYVSYKNFESLRQLFDGVIEDVKQQEIDELPLELKYYDQVAFKVREAFEFAVTQNLRERFDDLLKTLKLVLPVFLALMVMFAIVTNSAKDDPRKAVRPFLHQIAWNAEDEAVLKAAGIGEGCMRAGHPYLIILTDGIRPKVLAVPFDMGSKACKIVRVALSSDNHLASP